METKLEVLNFIKKNSEDRRNTTKELINVSNNPNFIKLLVKQEEGYEEFESIADKNIMEEFITPDSLNPLEKISSTVMVKLGTAINKSSSNIASLLIDNCTESISQLNAYTTINDVNPETLSIVNNYIDFERSNVHELQEYL